MKEYFETEIIPPLSQASSGTITMANMRELIDNSEVIDIESDAVPFSHKLLDNQIGASVGMGENFY